METKNRFDELKRDAIHRSRKLAHQNKNEEDHAKRLSIERIEYGKRQAQETSEHIVDRARLRQICKETIP